MIRIRLFRPFQSKPKNSIYSSYIDQSFADRYYLKEKHSLSKWVSCRGFKTQLLVLRRHTQGVFPDFKSKTFAKISRPDCDLTKTPMQTKI